MVPLDVIEATLMVNTCYYYSLELSHVGTAIGDGR